MYKQNNRFSRRSEGSIARNTMGNRIGKPLAGGKFHASRKSDVRKDDELDEKKAKAEKPVVRKILSFDDIKNQVVAWMENDRIPGKLQAWFTAEATPENSDWRIIKEYHGAQENLVIDAPSRDMKPLELVKRVLEQLHKEHLRIFKKALRQIWFRATGDGRFALLVQVNVKGKISAHGYKTFVDFIERSCPEVISCHQIQCLPDRLFDPADAQGMKVESKCSFGSSFMPIASTGFSMHVLDWTPRIKDAWLNLPVRIKDAIHPNREDRFFEFCSGPSYVSASLAPFFKQVEALDCRESAMQSSKLNIRNLATQNMRFHRSHLDANFVSKFFSKSDNAEGRWTFYLNLGMNDTINSENAFFCRPGTSKPPPRQSRLSVTKATCSARTSRSTWNRAAELSKFFSCSCRIELAFWARTRPLHTVHAISSARKNAPCAQIRRIFRILCKKRHLLSKEKIKLFNKYQIFA